MAQEIHKTKEIRTEIIINAPKEKVWQVFTEFEKYSEWNPFIKNISGKISGKEKLKVTLQLKGKNPMMVKPVVQEYTPGEKFEWLGKTPLGIFSGRHYFILESVSENQVKFIQGEKFTGWLTGPILKNIGSDTREGFIAMNRALKEQAENKVN